MDVRNVQPLNLTVLVKLGDFVSLAGYHVANSCVVAASVVHATVRLPFELLANFAARVANHPDHHLVLGAATFVYSYFGLTASE